MVTRKLTDGFHATVRERFGRFLNSRPAKEGPLSEVVGLIQDSGFNAVIFGGVVRDLAILEKPPQPRDIDIVIDGALDHIVSLLSPISQLRRTRFGGIRMVLRAWSFDIWPLANTWAFQHFGLEPTFQNLPKTTFFNVEAVAAELTATRGRARRIYSWQFEEAVNGRILDVNFEPNPFPQLCVVRGLLTAARLDFGISRRLGEYMLLHGQGSDMERLIAAQLSHYGIARLRREHLSKWLATIEEQLSDPERSHASLDVGKAEQLELWKAFTPGHQT